MRYVLLLLKLMFERCNPFMKNHVNAGPGSNILEAGNPPAWEAPVSRAAHIPRRWRAPVIAAGSCVALLVAGATWAIVALNQPAREAHKKERAVPVNVAVAESSEVPIEIRSVGNVTPYSVVNVTPQVGGQLVKVYFTQGQFVRKGDLLFQIDSRQYDAAVSQAEGNVAKDRAQIEAAQANLAKDMAQVGALEANLSKDTAQANYANAEKGRYSLLVSEGAVSHEQSDQMNTNAATAQATIQADQKAIENARAVVRADQAAIKTAQGTLKADEGAADNARIQLGWTQIRSPIDGRTGSLNVYEGNVVSASSTTPLVTIAQVSPIYVTVTVPEQYLDDVRRAQRDGVLKMQALIEGVKTDSAEGTISFIENTVNMTTGTILLRASFANANQHLFPGQFVDVVLTMPPSGKSVVVPARAIQTTQSGQSVYLVKRNGRAVLTTVEVGQTYGDRAAVTKGIAAGDLVVTDGQLELTPGARVQVQKDEDNRSRNGS